MAKPKKIPKASSVPSVGKRPIARSLGSDECISWKVGRLMRDGYFGWDHCSAEHLAKVLARLSELEKVRFEELAKHRDHPLTKGKLSREAIREITDRGFEEFHDMLFSLHFDGLTRVIGFRDRSFFQLVWFDPEHQFCPSNFANN